MFFEQLNSIETSLSPITEEYWNRQHKWIYDEIGKRLTDDHIVDLGGGCGLMSCYLLYNNYIKTVIMYDGRSEQVDYARKLRDKLGLTDRLEIVEKFVDPTEVGTDKTIVTVRFGSLANFEEFLFKNKLITVTRTLDTYPYLILNKRIPWKEETISFDSFSLNYLEFDFYKAFETFANIIEDERFMEDINPIIKRLAGIYKLEPENRIGNDTIDLLRRIK